ncbi:hypothetical protein BS297_17085 [Rhodococcus erythropolis]|uniref:Uncharacterized protein n=1 Tax=Rhodococcus erythropolis TaxID=1833 RepID=A0A5N5E154_RHOER|nr:hypothetical protein BS297_17085 [Rhodococcus erythropolis]
MTFSLSTRTSNSVCQLLPVPGQRIRRIDTKTGATSKWATISMTLPSAEGKCWLVSTWDASVDVWRIDIEGIRYEVHP